MKDNESLPDFQLMLYHPLFWSNFINGFMLNLPRDFLAFLKHVSYNLPILISHTDLIMIFQMTNKIIRGLIPIPGNKHHIDINDPLELPFLDKALLTQK